MDHITAATFLLEGPPLDEMDELIASVAEKYRFNMINKEVAIDELINKHKSFLTKYITNNIELNEMIVPCKV